MTLKHKKQPVPPEPVSSKPDNWSGPWGRINPTSADFDVVRFCQGATDIRRMTHSYPYRVISCWRWTNGRDEEELQIEASVDMVIVRGKGLDRIVEALDQGSLELLCEIPGTMPPDIQDSIWISTIKVEKKQTE